MLNLAKVPRNPNVLPASRHPKAKPLQTLGTAGPCKALHEVLKLYTLTPCLKTFYAVYNASASPS